MYIQGTSVQIERGAQMNAKTDLTGFLGEPLSRPELMHLLAEAGLELWQAPEGFWAVRLKPAAMPPHPDRPRYRPPRRTR